MLQDHVLIAKPDGTIVELIHHDEAGDNVEAFRGIISPGFINCHCHLELSHMKGHIPKNTGLVDFVLKVVNERHYAEAEILAAIEAAETEMKQNGIVAVGDICNNALTIPQKMKGRLRYYNFIEASGFPPAVAAVRFKRASDIYDMYAVFMNSNAIVPHAPYSVSPELFRRINAFTSNRVLSIHNQETSAEDELFEAGAGDLARLYERMNIDISFFRPSGKSSLQTYLPYLDKAITLLLVHNVHTSEKDLSFLKHQPVTDKLEPFFCLCPNANLYISNQLPDINRLLAHDCAIVLGTDSLASNDQLSILEEMKTISRHFPELPLASQLAWATSNGARALQMETELGSFSAGKKPGIVLIEQANGLKLQVDSSSRRLL